MMSKGDDMTAYLTQLSPQRVLELQMLWLDIVRASKTFMDISGAAGPNATFHLSNIRAAHDHLSDLLSAVADPNEIAFLKQTRCFRILSPLLRHLNAELHRRTEIAEALARTKDRSTEDTIGDMWITTGFQKLLRAQANRWKLLNLLCSDIERPIYVVGGGALPQSQWILHQCTGRQIISVEKDLQSVLAARGLLSAQGLNDTLPVVHADGRWASYKSAAAVVIATLVPEKIDVVHRVEDTVPTDAILNIRVPIGLHAMWRTDIDLPSLERIGWVLRDHWYHSSSAISSLTFSRRFATRSTVYLYGGRERNVQNFRWDLKEGCYPLMARIACALIFSAVLV
jgi:hypothetical protein